MVGSTGQVFAPDPPFIELKQLFLVFAEPTVAIEKKLIELGWLDVGGAEHGVDLSTMMDLMFEQVQQQPVDSFAHHTVGTHQVDGAGEVVFPQGFAERHQPLVGSGLVVHQLGKGQGLGEVLYLAIPVAFQGGEVIAVHFQDVAKRGLDGRCLLYTSDAADE